MLEIHGNMRNILAVEFGSDKTWDSVASTTAEQTATIRGLKSTDKIISVTKPTHQTGLGVVGWRVSAADTISITFETTATVTPTASEVYTAFIARLEHTQTDANA
jgi:hypothetical protein